MVCSETDDARVARDDAAFPVEATAIKSAFVSVAIAMAVADALSLSDAEGFLLSSLNQRLFNPVIRERLGD